MIALTSDRSPGARQHLIELLDRVGAILETTSRNQRNGSILTRSHEAAKKFLRIAMVTPARSLPRDVQLRYGSTPAPAQSFISGSHSEKLNRSRLLVAAGATTGGTPFY